MNIQSTKVPQLNKLKFGRVTLELWPGSPKKLHVFDLGNARPKFMMTTSSHKLQNQCFLIQAYYVSLCSIFNTDYFLQRNCGQFIRSYLPHFADIKHKLIKKRWSWDMLQSALIQ